MYKSVTLGHWIERPRVCSQSHGFMASVNKLRREILPERHQVKQQERPVTFSHSSKARDVREVHRWAKRQMAVVVTLWA